MRFPWFLIFMVGAVEESRKTTESKREMTIFFYAFNIFIFTTIIFVSFLQYDAHLWLWATLRFIATKTDMDDGTKEKLIIKFYDEQKEREREKKNSNSDFMRMLLH